MRDCLPCVAEMILIGTVRIVAAVVYPLIVYGLDDVHLEVGCFCDGIELNEFVWGRAEGLLLGRVGAILWGIWSLLLERIGGVMRGILAGLGLLWE